MRESRERTSKKLNLPIVDSTFLQWCARDFEPHYTQDSSSCSNREHPRGPALPPLERKIGGYFIEINIYLLRFNK